MASNNRRSTRAKRAPAPQPELIDPRHGDIEDDASSTKRRSMLSLFGSMMVEISLPKLIVAWIMLLVVPGLLLGLAPIVFVEWLTIVTDKLASLVIGLWSLLILGSLIAIAWFGWRALFRMAEKNFWALNSIVVEPSYASFREAFRQLAERLLPATPARHAEPSSAPRPPPIAGILVCLLALLVLWLVWPHTHLYGSISEIDSWKKVAVVALANSLAAITAYLAVAALVWGFADAAMAQPRTLRKFAEAPKGARIWRIVHLSDIHVVGERYGFRLESGRSGPRGNDRLRRLLDQLEALDAKKPFDTILITGDMTDAGISSEWAELLDALAAHPSLARPGVDAARQSRSQHRRPLQSGAHGPAHQPRPALAPIAHAVGHECGPWRPRARGRPNQGRLGGTLAEFLKPHRADNRAVCRRRPAGLRQGDPRAMGQRLPADRPAGARRRARHRPAQLERRHAFLLHQRARHGLGRPDAGLRHRPQNLSARRLDRGAASSSRWNTPGPPSSCRCASARR